MRSFGGEESIFEDMDRLNPNTQTYQPESLPERESELDQLHSALRPATMGSTPLNAFVFGQPGQGKTVGIRLKTAQLQDFADEKGLGLHVVHVRCKGMDKSYHVMTHLVKALREKRFGPGEELPSGHQKKTLLSMIIDELEAIGGTVIVILDEIDAIGADDYILYELPRAEPDDVRLSIIGITNDLQFREGWTPTSAPHSARTKSSSHPTTPTNSGTSWPGVQLAHSETPTPATKRSHSRRLTAQC